MDREALQARIHKLFLGELDAALVVLNQGVVQLEGAHGERTAALVQELFRVAHSVKGAAHAAGASDAVAAAHALEEGLNGLREGARTADADLVEELLSQVDQLTAVRAGLTQPPGPPPPIAAREPGDGGAAVRAPVRVAAESLDAVMDRAAELVTAAALLDHDADARPARRHRSRAAERRRALSRAVADVAEAAAALSLQTFSEACHGLERVGHDVAASSGKQVHVSVVGRDVEIDRSVVDALREPLLHLVRNAVDHGIEEPEARRAAGKPDAGAVQITAALQGGRLVVTVEDDGRGLDRSAVRAAATERGLTGSDEAADLVFAPGVTTSSLTDVSGRGVGLDAVRARIQDLGGSAVLDDRPGGGTVVTLVTPITLAIIRGLVVRAGDQRVCLPLTAIRRLHRTGAGGLRLVDGRPAALVDGQSVPLVPLAVAAQLAEDAAVPEGSALFVVPDAPGQPVGLLVDGVTGEVDAVLKPVPERLAGLDVLLGTTILDDGQLALVLNVPACVAHARASTGAQVPSPAPAPAVRRAPRVIVADDTLTTRTLEVGILEAAGYEVLAAGDGEEAWRLLEEHGADVVLTDVHMPTVDGYELCRRIRASERFGALPVVMVTSLGTDEDRQMGLDAGASAYLVKADFSQETLLDVIERSL